MSSNPPEPRSIASQLVLLFTVAAAFLLTCGLGSFYLVVVRHAFAEDNAVLRDKIFAFRAALKKGGPELLQDELKSTGAGWRVRLIDSGGQLVTETQGMTDSLPPGVFPPPEQNSWQFVPRNFHRAGQLFSLATVRADVAGQRFTLQIAQDRSGDEQLSREFGALLAILLAGGILVSTLIGIVVTKRGLRPLALMTGALARISPGHLHERVAPGGWPREIQPLALAFDKMLDRLEDSFTRLSQFSADLAHELRTPIANIRGEAEVALTRPRSTAEYLAVIESTVAECERLSGIVDNLLFLARAEAAESEVERTSFDGRAAVEKIAAYYQTMAEERRINLLITGQGKILADPLLFSRAISNLLDNSLRFTPDGGTISISIATSPEHAEVLVADTGSGISAEHLPKVFDRFYRAEAARSSHGAGLGLALVKSIMSIHGGTASLESEPGRGTKVTLIFPSETSGNSMKTRAAKHPS